MTAGEGVTARHSSASAEHFTPPYIVEAARATLGAIDFDPFSCAKANETVKARLFYADPGPHGLGPDGWTTPWLGNVFVNPPGGRGPNNESNQKRAWFRLVAEYEAGRVEAAIFICFSVELLQTTQVKPSGRLPLDFPICYPSRRVAYVKEDGAVGGSPPHSSCIICVPGRRGSVVVESFKQAFAWVGKVVVPA